MALNDYVLLGRSGLRVSPMSLGTMTFGDDWGWGADASESRRILDAYLERGGNFIDTANVYTNGSAERLLGEFLKGRRDVAVLATKYTLNLHPGDPNGGGNHRKSLQRAVEESLKRLQTDYVDLLYMHMWDGTTPVEEVMRGFDDLVRAGKVLYAGVSDIPAWQAARMQTLADLRGWSPLVALQIEYSLAQRAGERDLVPMADELGMHSVAWSPLAMGILTGKYTRADLERARAQGAGNAPGGDGGRGAVAYSHDMLDERTLGIGEVVKAVAAESGHSPAQVALAWLLQRSPNLLLIPGTSSVGHLKENLKAADLVLSAEAVAGLDRIGGG